MDRKKDTFHEFLRFTICGGIATAVDFIVFGVVIYLMSPASFNYSILSSLTANRDLVPTLSVLIGTGIGFSMGLLINYLISITYVYNYTERAKKMQGILIFIGLSITGLILNILLMKFSYDVLMLHHWISKIIVTAIVFVYNFITKRYIVFRE